MSRTPEQEKALAKLKKCLALAASSEPHEAAAALRQAQALMRQHALTEDDVEASRIDDELVKTREGFGRCVYLAALGRLLHKAFGVSRVIERNPGSAARANIRYIGPSGRPTMAAWAHKVITKAVDDAWNAHLVKHPRLKTDGGKRTAFRLGWLAAVEPKVMAIGFTEAEKNAVDLWMKRTYANSLMTMDAAKPKAMDNSSYLAALAGAQQGAKFDLHRPMTGASSGPAIPKLKQLT